MTDRMKREHVPAAGTYVAPTSALQAAICDAFRDTLRIGPIGLDDDLFDFGADSVLAATLALRLTSVLGKEVAVSMLLDAPAPRKLDRWASALAGGAGTAPVKARGLVPVDVRAFNDKLRGFAAVPLKYGLHGVPLHLSQGCSPLFWWFNFPEIEFPNVLRSWPVRMPLVALFSGGSFAMKLPLARHGELAERAAQSFAEELLAGFPGVRFRLGGNCFGGRIAMLVAEKLVAAGREVETLSVLEFASPDLYRFPGRLQLIYGQHSPTRFRASLRIGEPGWETPFLRPPHLSMLDMGHGQAFRQDRVTTTAETISQFILTPPESPR